MPRRLETVAVGFVLAVLLIGVALIALTTPGFTRLVVVAVDAPALSGLDHETTLQTAEEVRSYVSGGSVERTLPTTVAGRPGFDGDAVSHLDDVRSVIGAARLATGLCAAMLAAWMVAALVRRRWTFVTGVLRVGAGIAAVSVVLAFVLGALDFDRFFAGFHGLFFESGTWTFSSDALLIQLFPTGFWVTAGIAWAALVLGASAACAVGAGIVDARLARSSA